VCAMTIGSGSSLLFFAILFFSSVICKVTPVSAQCSQVSA
jgi:hypothetical protein